MLVKDFALKNFDQILGYLLKEKAMDTFDIDKVLDDFEEQEALQVKQIERTESNVENWQPWKSAEENHVITLERCQLNQSPYIPLETTLYPFYVQNDNQGSTLVQSEMGPSNEIIISQSDFPSTLKNYPTQEILKNLNVNSLCYETVEQHRCNSLDRDIPNLLDKVAAVAAENIGVPVASNKTHIVALSVEEKDHETKEYKLDNEVLNMSVKNSNLSESDETVFHSSVSNDCCLTEYDSPTVLNACNDSENCNIYKIQISEHDNGLCKNLLDDRSDFSSEGSFFNALSVKCEKSVTDSNYVVDASNIEKEVCSEINGTQNSEILELDFPESCPVYNMIEDDIIEPFCNKVDYNENCFKRSERQNWKSSSHETLMQDLVLQQNNSVLQNGNRCNESQPNTKLGPNNAVVVEVVCDNFSAKKLQFEKTLTKQSPTEPACEKESNDEISANVSSICKPIGFSDNEDDESLDVAVINDYLGDISEGHLIQDEDSGVSSQEGDINGNNMLPYASNKCDREASEHYSKTIDLKNADEPFNMVPITENNQMQESVYGNLCASEKSYNVKKYINVFEKNISNADTFESDLTEEESIYCGARPKQKENNAVEPVTPDNIDSSGKSAVLLENMDTQHSDANDDPQTVNCSITPEKRDIDDNCYISNCSELDYVQEFVDENNVDSFSGDNKFNAIDCSENSDCSLPRLQRPTTLDLPSRSILKPFDDCTDEDDSALPSCDSIVDDTSERLLISNEQSMLDDSSHTGDQSIMQCDILNEVEQSTQLGSVKPFWIPDAAAPNCMHCQIKFSMFKRRHHCRACGKVLCARCCYQKAPLAYLQNKEDRVCEQCFVIVLNASKLLSTVSGESPSSSSCGSSPNFSPTSLADHYSPKSPHRSPWRPHPNNPDDYCSTVPPLQQAHQSLNCPPPTVMVPIGVLKRGNKPRGEPKQVIFSDGIRPGGDLTDLTESVENVLPYRRQGGRRRVDKAVTILTESSLLSCNGIAPVTANKKLPHPKTRHKRVIVSDPEGPLPPVLLPLETVADLKPDMDMLLSYLQDVQKKPVVFAPTKNMHILTKIAKLDCCFGKECWCFTSHGLCAVGQDEVMVILERLKDENTIPRDIFKLYVTIYGNASKGSTVGELGHVVFPEGILGRLEPAGFLFVRPTFQCLSNLVVPNTPFLVAILIQKWEIPWAKVFPLRLMLRFGAESRYYPCSLLSNRDRNPVYSEIGRTIIKCLADFKNYQFTLPVIPGLVIHVEDKKTYINIPRNRYEKVLKVINSNTEHVLSLGSNFSSEADSHLVCMQKDEENYETQAINIGNTPRRVIGASFIIFSGALKSSLGLTAKFSVLEDGLFVEILPETMAALHSALTDMRDLIIPCGEINTAEVEAVVTLQWTRDDRKFNLGVRSSVDDRSLEGVQSVRIHNFSGYEGEHYLIRWTEVFFIELDENENSRRNDGVDPSRLAEAVARACCMSLTPYLDQLADADFTKIGLRVTLDSEGDKVEYEVGSRGKSLPSVYMNVLDNGLIPVISRLSGSSQDGPISLELIFHILIK